MGELCTAGMYGNPQNRKYTHKEHLRDKWNSAIMLYVAPAAYIITQHGLVYMLNQPIIIMPRGSGT